jgi:RHS repeat-associated protein
MLINSKTKQIYAGEQLVATIETVNNIVSPYYVHTDNLGSTNVVSNSSGVNVQLLDYYPFGNQRISSGTYNEQRKFIGQINDADTGLDYLNARYYKSDIGKFISQDSMFWKLPQELLIDPQQMNSYSYARNNPVNMKDPSGNKTVKDSIKSYISSVKSFFQAKTAYAPKEINLNYQRTNGTILSVPLRDNNINSKSGTITGDVYSLVKNQGIELNRTNHEVNSLESTSLESVQQNTVLGAIDLKQQCIECNTMITGGTERGTKEHPIHDSSPGGHWYGFKLDFKLNDKLNNFIQNNFTSTGSRTYDNAFGYQDNSGNNYWRESNHWDVKYNHSYQYQGYSLDLN